ncbi:Ankyrin repeat-containing protein isoform 1 [Cladophialophora immunda]|nr:Ankyrin repeat-containing protein isoform 1 [Cladophialophora immunda]
MGVSTTVKPIDDRPPPQTSSRKRQRMSVYGNSRVTRRADDDASDSESDVDPSEENILKITETIGGTVTRLFRLSNAVRKSAKANRARKIERYRDDEEANKAIDELRLYTKCYIELRFPEAPEALRSALIEANALRLRRLYYQRSHRRRLDLSIQRPETTSTVVQLPKMTGSAPALRFAPNALPNPTTTNKMQPPSPAPATNATTARQTAVAAFYAKSTTEVPRAKSVLVNNKLSFPPIPPTQQCPYCGVIVEFKNTARSLLWQNHVIGDLEPFICVFPHCLEGGHHGHGTGPLTFETSKAWSSHMQTAHGHTWECRAPSHDPIFFDQEIQYQEHSIKEHGVPEAHAGILSNAARRPVADKVLECPFGDDFQPSGKVESNAVFTSEALQSHVAGHMKEIALLTLQKLPGDDDENVENVDSDQPLEDDGPAGAFRGSMYSVLDDEDLDFQDDDPEAADGNVGHREEDISARVTVLDLEDKDDLGMTNLHHAVQAGDLGLVESLIQSGVSVNFRDENGQTPLHYAAERGFIECMEILVMHGADLRMVDKFGFSPFLWAVVAGQEGAIAGLLFMDADADSFSADGKSALAWAASLGWYSTAKMLVEHRASISNIRDTQQTLPLEEAAASGNLPTVRLLLECGEDPNHRNRDGWAAIHWAAEEGYLEIVRLLLDAGANPNAASSYGTSPLHCAANGGHVSIVSLLLLQRADPLKSTCHGWTALHHAAFMGHSHVVQRLLEDDRVRSTASQQDNHGWSVLHLAIHSRDLATVRILLDKSVIAEPQTLFDESGLTAEEWLDRGLASHSQKATANLAFSKSRCCRAVTSLRQAATSGNVSMIKLLFKMGHDINGVNSGRRTALYYAAKKRMLSIMDLLLDLGADPNILPAGRKNWEEFISPGDVLMRLNRAGYWKRDTDHEVERQIRQALRAQSQPSVQDQPAWFVSDESTLSVPDQSISHGSDRPSSPVPASSTLPSPDHAASSRPTHSPAPTHQTNDKKRKAKSRRAGWWKYFSGR